MAGFKGMVDTRRFDLIFKEIEEERELWIDRLHKKYTEQGWDQVVICSKAIISLEQEKSIWEDLKNSLDTQSLIDVQ